MKIKTTEIIFNTKTFFPSEVSDKILIFCGRPTEDQFKELINVNREVEMTVIEYKVKDKEEEQRGYWVEEEIALPYLKKTLPEEEYWYIKVLLDQYKHSFINNEIIH